MLEKLPRGVGHALRGVRAGYEKIIAEDDAFAQIPDTISLESPAFADGGDIPDRFTADGEQISPPLLWRDAPAQAASLVLVIEDPDAPSAEPLVHLLAWDLPPDLTSVDEGLFKSPHHEGLDENLGRNSFLQTAYLPPDPPTGHGPHSTPSRSSPSTESWTSTIRPAAPPCRGDDRTCPGQGRPGRRLRARLTVCPRIWSSRPGAWCGAP